MSDDKSKRRRGKWERIDPDEPRELEYWAKELEVSQEELEGHLRRVGPVVQDVRRSIAATKIRDSIIAKHKK